MNFTNKKSISLILIAIMMFVIFSFSGCGSSEESTDTASDSADTPVTVDSGDNIIEAEDSDFELLQTTLSSVYTLHFSFFDHSSMTTQEIINFLVPGYAAPGYEYYFGEIEQTSPSNDPQGRFEDACYAIPADNMNWIIENIFNVQPDPESVDTDLMYYEDGYYYIYANTDTYSGPTPQIDNWSLNEDGTYTVDVKYIYDSEEFAEDEPDGLDQMVVALKEIDGSKYWSFYSITNVQ